MIQTLLALLLLSGSIVPAGRTLPSGKSLVTDNVTIVVFPYEYENSTRAAAMPELKPDSELKKHGRRFEYLLINCPEIHGTDKWEERNEISKLYPDTNEVKRIYLQKYTNDKKLADYFEETYAGIKNLNNKRVYSEHELMEVASKFFYCSEVGKDTTIQAQVCVGVNGVKEIKSDNDYTLLAAFCYEAIFSDFEAETSEIWESFASKKEKACELSKSNFTSLENYLSDVKQTIFNEMKNDEVLKKKLMDYYRTNSNNVAFLIVK